MVQFSEGNPSATQMLEMVAVPTLHHVVTVTGELYLRCDWNIQSREPKSDFTSGNEENDARTGS